MHVFPNPVTYIDLLEIYNKLIYASIVIYNVTYDHHMHILMTQLEHTQNLQTPASSFFSYHGCIYHVEFFVKLYV